MAISLSELTGASTSGNVLNEVNSYADFLDSVPRLVNKADPSGNTDAVQTVATKQPRALPLIKDANGELGGYLYIPNASGNYAEGPSVTIGDNETWEGELDMVVTQWGSYVLPMGGGDWPLGFGLIFYNSGEVRVFSKGSGANIVSSGVTLGTPFNVKFGYDGTELYVEINDSRVYVSNTPAQTGSITHTLELSQQANIGHVGDYAINRAKLTVAGSVVFECDFRNPAIPHGASEFLSDSGHQVSVITSGNNPSKVIKKPVLRFSTDLSGLRGFFANQIDSGYMFAAFSLLGTGVSSGVFSARVFSVNETGGLDYTGGGGVFSARLAPDDLRSIIDTTLLPHADLYDSNNGDILHEVKLLSGAGLSKVNDADEQTYLSTHVLRGDEFNINQNEGRPNSENAAIDLEYLALFNATLTDAQADQVRNFINNRNKVFTLIDSQGYYFFDGAATDDGQVFTGSGSWNGRIVGSDNGDADMFIGNGTAADRPTTDGYKITFADNTDHFDIPSTTQAGWQIVGTSLGTFAYKVNANTQTELNLLGNLGTTAYRKSGDLYGIILLPESATSREIEEARKLLIDRGAADGAIADSYIAAWYTRQDMVEFKPVDMSRATNLQSAWNFTKLTTFPALDLSGSLTCFYGWKDCSDLATMGAINAENCSRFDSAWQNCSSLTQFPSGAKLGTEANNVNFESAWQSSGLTLFDTPLPTAGSLRKAFKSCTSLVSFSSELPEVTRVDLAWFANTSLTSFTTTDIKSCANFSEAWRDCTSLQSFPEDALLGTEVTGSVIFNSAWRTSGLTSFSTPLPTATSLSYTWNGCSSLTAFNVQTLPLATNIYGAFANCDSLTSFSTTMPEAVAIGEAWYSCDALSSFDVEEFPNATNCQYSWTNSGNLTSFHTSLPKCNQFLSAWTNCYAMADFSADVFANWNPTSINNGAFNETWDGCTSLTAQSVENILVPIAASGKWATTSGLEGGTALSDATIDIDYNVATGSLTAATLTAIETLNGRGWSVNINNEIIVPNILQLQPAAAYSLRSFDADADPTVVNVRRSSDGSLSDFTASQVSDGTLTSWVNTEYDIITPTLNNGGFEDGASGWNLNNAAVDTTDFYAGSNSVKLTITGGAGAYIYKGNLQAGLTYRVGFWAKISDASKQMRVEFGSASNIEVISFSSTDWEYKEVTKSATDVGFAFARQTGSGDYTINIDNITLTQLTADGYVTTFYDQSSNGNNSTQSTASSQPLIVENGVLVTEGGEAAISFDGASDSLEMSYNNLYGQSTLDSYYVTSTSDTSYIYPRDISGRYGFAAALGQTNSTIHNTYGTPSLYSNGILQSISNRGDVYSSNNGYKLVTHQGADTSAWISFSFGKYTTIDSVWDYAGKLQEMIFFNTDQSAQRSGIEKNINDHFNIY